MSTNEHQHQKPHDSLVTLHDILWEWIEVATMVSIPGLKTLAQNRKIQIV